MAVIARSLVGPGTAGAIKEMSSEDVDAVVRSALMERPQSLWVVDDLPTGLTADDVHEWLGPGAAKTLITTKSREYEGLAHQITLGGLQEEEAIRLLAERVRPANAAEAGVAADIVRELGGHPLAIDVAGASLQFQTYGQLLGRLRENATGELEMAAELREALPTGHDRSIAATFINSLSRLNEDAITLLTITTVLDEVPVPYPLLEATFAKLQNSSREGVRPSVRAALDHGRARSLIENPEAHAWDVHPLVKRVVTVSFKRENLSDLARAAAVDTLTDSLSGDYYFPEASTLPYLLRHARKLCEKPETLRETELLSRVATYELENGDYRAARATAQTVAELREEWLGSDALETLEAKANLAQAHFYLGDYPAARRIQEEVLPVQERLLGPKHNSTIWSASNLATTLEAFGLFRDALGHREMAVVNGRAVYGDRDLNTFTLMMNQAVTLKRLGDPRAALELGERALAGIRETSSVEGIIVKAMNNFANIVIASGDLERARNIQQEVVTREQALFGAGHPQTLAAVANLATILAELGEPQEALLAMKTVYQGQREFLGPHHPETIMTAGDLAVLFADVDDLERSRDLNSAVLEARRTLLGPTHPDTLRTMSNLAHNLERLGEYDSARPMFEYLVAQQTEDLEEDHPDTLHSMMHLSSVLSALGDEPGAKQWQEVAVAGFRRTLGDDHRTTLDAIAQLAMTCLELGDFEQAERLDKELRARGEAGE
jgi:tetratricopeptide (TPR) repeat protein